MAWGSHSEKEMIIGKVIFEISRKNYVHNNYETILTLYVSCIICSVCFGDSSGISFRKLMYETNTALDAFSPARRRLHDRPFS